MCREYLLGRAEIVQGIDVEKRVVGRHAPIREGADDGGEEAVDAAQILDDERLAQIGAERDRPKREGRVDDIVGAGDGDLGFFAAARRMKLRDEVGGEKRRVCRDADGESKIGPLRGEIIEPGQHTRQRPRKVRHVVGNDRNAEGRKPRRRAIGVDDDGSALRRQRRDHMRDKRLGAELCSALSAPPIRVARPPARMMAPVGEAMPGFNCGPFLR